MISEREMERAIISNPEKYLKESGLKLISEQYRIGNYIFDLLFEDRHGAKLIIELQHGVLDRNHTYKILDYYHEYKEKNAASFIELMIIANKIPDERKKRLSDWGVSFKEIPESVFEEDVNNKEYKENNSDNKINSNNETIYTFKTNINDSAENISPIDKLTQPTVARFTDKFKTAYEKSDSIVKQLFKILVDKTANYPGTSQYTTNKPDYRIVRRYIFCQFILHRSDIQIELRIDSHPLKSDIFELQEIKDPTRPGTKWIKFKINDEKYLEEALKLIKNTYEFSD